MKLPRGERGSVWIALTVLITFCWTMMAATLVMLARQHRSMTRLRLTTAALHLAEGGVEKALWELSRGNASYAGEADTGLDIGTFSVEVAREGDQAAITATGHIPGRRRPAASQTVRVVVRKAGGGYRVVSWTRS
ncbi:MAG: hypothetical protein HY927_12635 [Elusimicrobia bacterium]|nr:hypothetical protein [Elusimicrobiota bacterium]